MVRDEIVISLDIYFFFVFIKELHTSPFFSVSLMALPFYIEMNTYGHENCICSSENVCAFMCMRNNF